MIQSSQHSNQPENDMSHILIAKYTAEYKFITVKFMEDDSVEYVVGGEVSDSDLNAAITAGGANIPGYACQIEI